MSVVSFDGHDGFQSVDSRRLCCAARRPQFEAMASPFLAQRKEGCLFGGGSSFCIYQGRHKLSESPASSGQISDLHDVAAGE